GFEAVMGMVAQELLDAFLAVVEDDVDVCVAGIPHIAKELAAFSFGQGDQRIAELVEPAAQRRTPLLRPACLAAIAAAVRSPELHAMRAAPRCVVRNLALVLRRKLREKA